jgi:hypothetical protein
MIDLEFDTASQAEVLLAAMRVVWGRVEGTIMMNPQARIVEARDTKVGRVACQLAPEVASYQARNYVN